MDFLNFLMALSPIVVVLVGIPGFKKSAKTVSPVALLWTLILAFTYFNLDGLTFAENVKVLDPLVWKGIKEGLKIVLMVFGAFTILNLLRETGAIEDVKATIAQISDDRRVQVVIIGMMLPIFLEGAAGAGAPPPSPPRFSWPSALTPPPPSPLRCSATRRPPRSAVRA